MITKEDIKNVLLKKGDVRGAVFQTDINYLIKQGKDVALIEAKLEEWGIDLDFNKVNPMAWYPVAWRVATILAIAEVFGWSEGEIRKMGENAPKVSVIVKLFFKLFPDIEKFAQQIPNYWRKHYTSGELLVEKLDKTKREMTLHLKDFSFHPILCKYLEGYFQQATKLTRPEDSVVTVHEDQCSFRDNVPYEVYHIEWTK